MSPTILAFISTFAVHAPAADTVARPTDDNAAHGCGILGLFGCGFDDISLGDINPWDENDGDDDIDVDLGDCLGVDIDVGASCGILAGVDFFAECNPLSVAAACYAELGEDCGIEAFAACTAELTAYCQAELEAGGALFCDGHFIGADACLGDLGVDVDIDLDACVDLDLDVDVDIDVDLCLDLDVDLNLDCAVEVGAECLAACDPIAVEAKCYAQLGYDCGLDAFAACQAVLIAQCSADCELDGALFCDGGVYVGADICLDVELGLGLHL